MLTSAKFCGYRADRIETKGNITIAHYTFNPATFDADFAQYSSQPAVIARALGTKAPSIIYNDRQQRNGYQKIGVAIIQGYWACTRYNPLPILGKWMRKHVSDRCVFRKLDGGKSCSEFGIKAIDQLGQTGFKGMVQAVRAIRNYMNLCEQAIQDTKLFQKIQSGQAPLPVYHYQLITST